MADVNFTGLSPVEAELKTNVISLDGAKIPFVVLGQQGIEALLSSLDLVPPFGYYVEKVKIAFELAAIE